MHSLCKTKSDLSKMSPMMLHFLKETEAEGHFTGLDRDKGSKEKVYDKTKL
jgi:hypothetical protein